MVDRATIAAIGDTDVLQLPRRMGHSFPILYDKQIELNRKTHPGQINRYFSARSVCGQEKRHSSEVFSMDAAYQTCETCKVPK